MLERTLFHDSDAVVRATNEIFRPLPMGCP